LLLAGCSDPQGTRGLVHGHYAVPSLGLDVSYLRGGTPGGRRVIFVHGTPGDAAGWANLLRQAPPGFEFVAVDRPGFGQTLPAAALPTLQAQAAALAPLLRPGGRAILVGHSYGGPVIAEAAAEHPDRVAGLVIVAGALDPAQEKVLAVQRMGEWWGIRSLIPRSLRNANRELLPLKAELLRLAPRLRLVRAPVIIIHGTEDTNVPFANVAFMRAHFVRARPLRTIVLPGADHFLPWTQGALIGRAVAQLAAAT
jgi:pimeloyl-ACP methyl ester carboxylesterase